ncbi:putative transcription factor B3-Domain family [Helianthus annuus]|nr:putative transcription factor B3-Domain family [Helianthus annuus]
MLAVEQNDLIVFENVDIKIFKLIHIKGHHGRYLNPMFYCVMTNTKTKDLLLHTSFIDNYFKNDPLDYRFTLRFGNKLFWTVYIVRRFGTNYSIVDWLNISNDLHLERGDFVIFELLGYNDFNIRVFHKDGLHCIHPEPLRVEEVCEVEVDGNLEDETHRLSDMVPSDVDDPDYEIDVEFEDSEVESDANQHESAKDVEDGIVEYPIDVGDFYELKWVLTNRFKFPKDFAANVNLADIEDMTVVTGNGFSKTLALRSETGNKKVRYAFGGWTTFMRQAGLENGYRFLLRYYFNSATLMITNG